MDYIDYSEESTEDNPSSWTQKAFKKYFIESYHKIHNINGAVPWGIKETVFLSRMFKEFTRQDLADMMIYWHVNTHRHSVACQFSNLYSRRLQIFEKMKEATNDYRWE